jgi:hypothetical protein
MKENKEGPPKRLRKRAVDFVVQDKKIQADTYPQTSPFTRVHGLMEHEKEVGLIFWNTRKEKDARQACLNQ